MTDVDLATYYESRGVNYEQYEVDGLVKHALHSAVISFPIPVGFKTPLRIRDIDSSLPKIPSIEVCCSLMNGCVWRDV